MRQYVFPITAIVLLIAVTVGLTFAFAETPFFVWDNMNGAFYDVEDNIVHFNLYSGDDLDYYYFQTYDDGWIISDTIYGVEPSTEGEITGTYTVPLPEEFQSVDWFQLITKNDSGVIGGAWFN